jgi:hypothetical protein
MLMEKEATVAAGERGHFMILAGLLKLEEKEEKACSKHGGSKCWKKEIETKTENGGPCHALHRTYIPKDFCRRFGVNKEVFMTIVHGVRKFDTQFLMKKDAIDFQTSHQFRNTLWQKKNEDGSV